MYCLPRYLLMVFAFAGDSTITKAFAIFNFREAAPPAPHCYNKNRSLTFAAQTLPHFNKVLARQLFYQAQHLQLEERRDHL
jgi:hypothetical protein